MSFYTVKQMTMRYPAFTESSIRWLIFHEDKNGFYKCVYRVPGQRKIMIDEMEFIRWIRENRENPQSLLQ